MTSEVGLPEEVEEIIKRWDRAGEDTDDLRRIAHLAMAAAYGSATRHSLDTNLGMERHHRKRAEELAER
jgi:hypothetical protein